MKHVLRSVLILVTVLMLTVLTASVALAHDDHGSQGTDTDNVPLNPSIAVENNPAAANGAAQQPVHNPTCGGHDN